MVPKIRVQFPVAAPKRKSPAGDFCVLPGGPASGDIYNQKDTWIEPDSFVLSHLDGFQGIASKQGEDWSMDSIIDIEDHQFTDQRFVLCGHELAMEAEGTKLPDSFWEGYQSTKEINSTFEQSKPLFKLYYLSVWLCVFRNKNIGDIPNRDEKAEDTIKIIESLLSN